MLHEIVIIIISTTMNGIAPESIFVVLTILNGLCGAAVGLLWIQNRKRNPEYAFWFAAYVFEVIAAIMIRFRGMIPDVVSVILGNLFFILALQSLHIGLERFARLKGRQRVNFFLILIFITSQVYFTYLVPSLQIRIILFSVMVFLFSTQISWLLFHRFTGQIYGVGGMVGSMIFALFALISILRIPVVLVSPPVDNLLDTSSNDLLTIFSYQGVIIMITFGLFLIANQRLVEELVADSLDRIRTEQALMLRESLLSQSQAAGHVGDWRWDLATNQINGSVEMIRIFGLAAGETSVSLERLMSQRIHPDDQARIAQFIEYIIHEQKLESITYRVIHPDSSIHTIWVNPLEIKQDEQGRAIQVSGILQDITERTQYEIAIEKQNHQLKLLYETGQILSRSLDFKTIYHAFYIQVSQLMKCDVLYISAFDPLSQMITARYAVTDGVEGDISHFPPITLEPEGQGIQSPVIRSGKSRLINDYIAELKRINTFYYINEDESLILENNIPDDLPHAQSMLVIPTILSNDVTGVIQIQSYEKDAYSEQDLQTAELFAAQIAVAIYNARLYEESINEIHERAMIEEELRKTQKELTRLLAASELSRETLQKMIEEQRVADEQIRQLNRELETRVRERTAMLQAANQELEAFSYSVSHDLRAPLRALEGFSSALQEYSAGQLDEQGRHFLIRIQEATQRMSQLINDLLNLSRVTRSDFMRQPVDMSALAQSVFSDLLALEPQRQVTIDITPGMQVEGDANLLRIAFDNLLGNSLKFTSKLDHAVIQVGTTRYSGKVVYYVRDNGAGFNMDQTVELFAPFQRLHTANEFPGNGIGLSIVHRIITRHGGQIWPESHPGQGATFYFTLGEPI